MGRINLGWVESLCLVIGFCCLFAGTLNVFLGYLCRAGVWVGIGNVFVVLFVWLSIVRLVSEVGV